MKILVNARNGSCDFECDPEQKILHAGLRRGFELPYECATGTCGTCKARLVSGRVESEPRLAGSAGCSRRDRRL